MRRLAAQNAAEGDESVVSSGERSRDGRDFECAGNADDVDVFVARAVSFQTIERAVEQTGDDVIVEAAGDDAEAETFGVEITFERARHWWALLN